MESDGSSDVYEPEEESDSPDTFSIDVEFPQNSHGNGSSDDVRRDVDPGDEPVNPNQAPNDEVHNDEISVVVPVDGALDVPFSVAITFGVPEDGQIPAVPPHVRKVDKMSYTPKWVSIGPIHHNRKSLWLTKENKRQFLGDFWDESYKEYLRSVMGNSEATVRGRYSMTFQGISSADFVDMLLTDGCFIVLLLCLNYNVASENVAVNPIFSTRWMLPEIGRDLLMIENQLPLFVLKEIFYVTMQMTNEVTELMPNETSFEEVALKFFKSFHIGKEAMVIKKHHTEGHHEHLLDLFHSLYLPLKSFDSGGAQKRRRNKKPLMARPSVQGKNWVPSATVLKSSGVRFYAKEANSLGIQFRRGRLRIPSISIDESSIIILKNLLAYEQSSRRIKPLFTSLVLFFSSMASVPDDIKLLREASIISHQLGDDQMLIAVLKLLSKQLECDVRDCSMKQQVEDIRAFCGSNKVKFWNPIGRILAQNVASFVLLYLSLLITFSLGGFRQRL